MKENRVLITGATGFIGKACVKEFIRNKWKVTALIHKNIPEKFHLYRNQGKMDFIFGSVVHKEKLKKAISGYINEKKKSIRIIIHCAARASDVGWDKFFYENNFLGVKNIIECASQFSFERFIFISTTDVYGIKNFVKADEKTSFHNNLRNPYPRYKIMAEEFIRNSLSKNNYVILRPAAVWGPGDNTILPRVIKFLRSTPFIIHFGQWKGKNRWPLAYVENVAKMAYFSSIKDDCSGQAFNIIDKEETSIDEYYRMLLSIFYPEKKKIKSITFPFIIGWIIGFLSTVISNVFNLKHPLFDPTLYGLYSVSRNLDFSGDKMEHLLRKNNNYLINRTEGLKRLKAWKKIKTQKEKM